MLIIGTLNKIYKPLISLFFISTLLGCSYLPKAIQNSSNHQLQGVIYSPSIIPENSEITISISPIDTLLSPTENLLNYQLRSKDADKTIDFKINLLENTAKNMEKLGISIRIEKNSELIMMSNKITKLPDNLSEKITLTVTQIK
ncbi:hypothetical protein ABN063_15940 [Providencia vermicola]|uniref:hypothetical protein n=1 Tax=Providencia vermicola TaxID=333965 RepID=UPI0032DB7FFB